MPKRIFPQVETNISIRLPAFSVVESITAFIIILISFGAGSMMYLQVINRDDISTQTQAGLLLDEVLTSIKTQKDFIEKPIEVEGMKIMKKIEPYTGSTDLYIITLTAINPKDESTLMERKEILQIKK